MFDDIFDRDWEPAILVCEQCKVKGKAAALTTEEKQLQEVRSRRIRNLLAEIQSNFQIGNIASTVAGSYKTRQSHSARGYLGRAFQSMESCNEEKPLAG
jgi:hypothetical protein